MGGRRAWDRVRKCVVTVLLITFVVLEADELLFPEEEIFVLFFVDLILSADFLLEDFNAIEEVTNAGSLYSNNVKSF